MPVFDISGVLFIAKYSISISYNKPKDIDQNIADTKPDDPYPDERVLIVMVTVGFLLINCTQNLHTAPY
ncbi:hypothetical protein GCM10023091_01930 [Ravibacter arvi]|uniref:Uncharacterized protein n=1 Tax=Ravibacter arvi TaxID=2051041 RepID=A0ABP8LLL2_9BACT